MPEVAPGATVPRPAPIAGMAADIARDETKIASREAGLAEQAASTAAAREQTLAPMEQKMVGALAAPVPERPKSQIPEFKPQPIVDAKEYESLSYGLMAMALIGGIASKGKWLEVGSALNGAMSGYLKGNQEVAAKQYKDYEVGFKTALAKEQQANREFEDVLKNRQLKIQDMISQYRVIAAKYDRQDALQAAGTRSVDAMWRSLEGRKTAMAKLEEQHYQTAEKLGQEARQFSERMEDRRDARADRRSNAGGAGGLGKPPAGYTWGLPNEEGQPTLTPIAGGPAAAKGVTADAKSVLALGKDLEKAKLNETVAVMADAKKVTPELAEYVTGPKSTVPDWMVTPEAREARQAIQKLFNITLKDRSGAAVTEQELERLKKEFGSGAFKTASQLINAIGKAEGIIKRHYAGVAASHGKPALSAYNKNLESMGAQPFLSTEETGAGTPKTIKGDEEYNALPSGAEFIGPDGQTRRKP